MKLQRVRNFEGFTLVELLVSFAIMSLLTGVIVYNQADFSDRVALSNSAGEVELQIRESQAYGISVREFQQGSGQFSFAYGVSVNISSNAGALAPTSYLSFADAASPSPNDGIYNISGTSWVTGCGSNSECLKIYSLARNNRISQICVIEATGTVNCSSAVTRADITFLRPDPSARITLMASALNSLNGSFPNFKGARIVLLSPRGNTKNIDIYRTGQISIQ